MAESGTRFPFNLTKLCTSPKHSGWARMGLLGVVQPPCLEMKCITYPWEGLALGGTPDIAQQIL